MNCPNPDCNEKIEIEKQRKTEGNFFYCKDCGTVVIKSVEK